MNPVHILHGVEGLDYPQGVNCIRQRKLDQHAMEPCVIVQFGHRFQQLFLSGVLLLDGIPH